MRHVLAIVAGLATVLPALGVAHAAEVEIKMLNRSAKGVMVFEPDLVRIQPGDSVHFVAKDKGHDAETIPGMLPSGAEPFKGKTSEDLTVTFDVPGVYGVKCKPHYGMGMVALVVVGQPENLDPAKAVQHPGKAKQVFGQLFDEYQKVQKAER